MWRQIRKEWIDSSQGQKIATIIILMALLPFLALVINHLGPDFDTGANPYQHMATIYQAVHGKPLYAPLSTEYQSITYTPLYWYISAIPCKLFGMSFFWPRLISLLASLGCGVILFLWSWRLTEHNFSLSAAVPVIFLSTTYIMHITNWAIDVNVNALHFFFTFLGFYLLINPTRRNVILAAVATSAAVLAKQTALAYVIAMTVMLFFRARRQIPVFLGLLIVILGVSFWYLESFDGDFYYQIVKANKGVLWVGKRIFAEVLPFFPELIGFMLPFALVHLLIDDCFDHQSFWRRIWKSEYVMTAAGLGVAVIATPKIGSGPIHCLVAIAGLSLCGMAGLYQTAKLIPKVCSERICLGVALAQVITVLLLAVPTYPVCLIDRYDREKFTNIANVFRAGRTCLFCVPYIQSQFNQPPAGVPDDDPVKWIKGRLTYEFIPNELTLPFKNQEFDYVIVGPYLDPNHPVAKAIMDNYKTLLGRFPAHPKYPRTGVFRDDCFVLKANRLQANLPAIPR